MSDESPGRVTQMLRDARDGEGEVAAELLPLVYAELRKLARLQMARTPPGNTLQPTALVHEAYIHLVGSVEHSWHSRGHFFAAAAQAMRQILVDQARRKARLKRGGGRHRVDLTDAKPFVTPPSDDMLALDEALQELERVDPRKAEIIMLRYFAGLTEAEAAAALGVSAPTIRRECRFARALLSMRLKVRQSHGPGATAQG